MLKSMPKKVEICLTLWSIKFRLLRKSKGLLSEGMLFLPSS